MKVLAFKTAKFQLKRFSCSVLHKELVVGIKGMKKVQTIYCECHFLTHIPLDQIEESITFSALLKATVNLNDPFTESS